MPIYEFHCEGCRRKVSVFQRSITSTAVPACPECGSENLRRLVSQFAFRRSSPGLGDFDMENLPPDVDENDPQSVARWARRMGEEVGEDLGPDFDQMLDQMAAGGMPGDDGGDSFDDEF